MYVLLCRVACLSIYSTHPAVHARVEQAAMPTLSICDFSLPLRGFPGVHIYRHDVAAEAENAQHPLPHAANVELQDNKGRPLVKKNMEFKYGPCARRESLDRWNAAVEPADRGVHQAPSAIIIPEIKTAAAARQLPGPRQRWQLADIAESAPLSAQAHQTVAEYVTPAPAVTRQLFVNFGTLRHGTPIACPTVVV